MTITFYFFVVVIFLSKLELVLVGTIKPQHNEIQASGFYSLFTQLRTYQIHLHMHIKIGWAILLESCPNSNLSLFDLITYFKLSYLTLGTISSSRISRLIVSPEDIIFFQSKIYSLSKHLQTLTY